MGNVDLTARIGPLLLKNPVMLASGTCGYGMELWDLVDLASLGAIVVKGISLEARPGNPPPRIIETPCGLLNAIGLENVGVKAFLEEKLPWLRGKGLDVIVNILGTTPEDYGRLAERLDGEEGILALEVNISCPNVKEGGVSFGKTPEGAYEVTRRVREATDLPVIVKLTPNVGDIAPIARAAEDGGADALSLINTVLGMAIDIEARCPALKNVFGGLSGPAIKPVALRMVWEVVRTVGIPVIGVGGITTWQDAVEFFMAGAKAIQVGTGTLVEPGCAKKVLDGIRDFMQQKGYGSIEEMAISVS